MIFENTQYHLYLTIHLSWLLAKEGSWAFWLGGGGLLLLMLVFITLFDYDFYNTS